MVDLMQNLSLLIYKTVTTKSYMQSNRVMLLLSLTIPHVIFVEYDMCSLLLSPHISGWTNEQVWQEDYRDEY
jgi:hypothetical protein